MINGGADDGQAEGEVHPGLEGEHFEGNVSLVVIESDNGIKALALVAATDAPRRAAIFPYLLEHLGACRPKDVPQRAEKIAAAVDAGSRAAFVAALEERMGDLSGAQAARVRKVIKQVSSL